MRNPMVWPPMSLDSTWTLFTLVRPHRPGLQRSLPPDRAAAALMFRGHCRPDLGAGRRPPHRVHLTSIQRGCLFGSLGLSVMASQRTLVETEKSSLFTSCSNTLSVLEPDVCRRIQLAAEVDLSEPVLACRGSKNPFAIRGSQNPGRGPNSTPIVRA